MKFPAYRIAFEGIDGSGKGTQIQLLKKKLVENSVKVKTTSFKPVASKPLRIAAENITGDSSDMRVLFERSHVEYVHTCDQYLNYFDSILPLVKDSQIILQDRCKITRIVNAEYANSPLLDTRRILDLIPNPNLIFCLLVKPEIALDRIQKRGTAGKDETLEFLDFADKAYRKIAKTYQNIITIDGDNSPRIISEIILSEIKSKINIANYYV